VPVFDASQRYSREPIDARRVFMLLVPAARRAPNRITASEIPMTITAAHIQPIVALIAGVLILLMPRLLNFIVAIYLIFIGLVGLGVFKLLKIG
jgi:Protein of unknown function (DUF3096)